MRKEQTFTEELGVRLWLYWVSQRNVCVSLALSSSRPILYRIMFLISMPD